MAQETSLHRLLKGGQDLYLSVTTQCTVKEGQKKRRSEQQMHTQVLLLEKN